MRAPVRSFRDLVVYQLALEHAHLLYVRSKHFPKDERYRLTTQLRRSSSAVGPLLAEAWGRRIYPKAFLNTLTMALGESGETQAWLDHAMLRGYISESEYEQHNDAWQKIGGKIHSMIQRHEGFTGPRRN